MGSVGSRVERSQVEGNLVVDITEEGIHPVEGGSPVVEGTHPTEEGSLAEEEDILGIPCLGILGLALSNEKKVKYNYYCSDHRGVANKVYLR
jgi:hypothetical protein